MGENFTPSQLSFLEEHTDIDENILVKRSDNCDKNIMTYEECIKVQNVVLINQNEQTTPSPKLPVLAINKAEYDDIQKKKSETRGSDEYQNILLINQKEEIKAAKNLLLLANQYDFTPSSDLQHIGDYNNISSIGGYANRSGFEKENFALLSTPKQVLKNIKAEIRLPGRLSFIMVTEDEVSSYCRNTFRRFIFKCAEKFAIYFYQLRFKTCMYNNNLLYTFIFHNLDYILIIKRYS